MKILLSSLLLLCGCVTLQTREDNVNQRWQGAYIVDFIKTFGAPDETMNLQNDCHLYVWIQERTVTRTTTEDHRISGNPLLHENFAKRYGIALGSVDSDTYSVHCYCKANVFTDPEGKITLIKYSGNGCR